MYKEPPVCVRFCKINYVMSNLSSQIWLAGFVGSSCLDCFLGAGGGGGGGGDSRVKGVGMLV